MRSTIHATCLPALLAVAALTACGGSGDKPASQVAAKVNKEELSVHQINFVLQQRPNKTEDVDIASREVLEKLIDQELYVQKATELKLDRDPAVLQRLEALRRDIIARAYAEKVGAGAQVPTTEDISAYYGNNPALFKERRVYTIRELLVQADADQTAELRRRLEAAKTFDEFVDHVRATGLRASAQQFVRASEQLPLNQLEAFARWKDGETKVEALPKGLRVWYLAQSRTQPVSEDQARAAISTFLLNERKQKLIEEDLKSLRAAAKIEYVGNYAQSAASAAAARAAEAASAAAGKAILPESVAMPAPALPAASAVDLSSVNAGMGLRGGSGAAAAAATAQPQASTPLNATDINSGLGLKR